MEPEISDSIGRCVMIARTKTTSVGIKEIAPRFKNRNGGYTRVIPLSFRRGDGADMVILELTEKKVVEKLKERKMKEHLYEVNREIAKENDDINQKIFLQKRLEEAL